MANSYASAIGALAHEMAHMFGAGHTRTGLMGGDIDFVARVFCADVRTVWAPQRCVVVAKGTTSGTWLGKWAHWRWGWESVCFPNTIVRGEWN